MVSLSKMTSIAHHDGFSICTWLGGAIEGVSDWGTCRSNKPLGVPHLPFKMKRDCLKGLWEISPN